MPEPQVVTKMNPQLRSGLTALGSIVAGASAATMWLSTHSVDIYALVDKMNTALAQTVTLVTTIGGIVTLGLSLWNSRPSKKVADLVDTGVAKAVIVTDPAIAAKLGPEVVTSVHDLPPAARV